MSKWEMVRLPDIFDLQMGKTPARNNPDYWNGTNKWVSIADLGNAHKFISHTKECISDKAISESGIKATPQNTVMMSFKLSIGKTAISAEDIFTNEAIMSFIDKKTYPIDIYYIYYLFSGKDWSEGTNKAVMGITLNKATLSQIAIPLPPLETQKQIAATLDKVTHTIDLCNSILEKLDLLVKARFTEMFGDAFNNESHWEKALLGTVCDVRDGTHDSPQYYDVGYPLVTSKNVTGGKIDFSNCSLICEKDFKKINERSKVDYGDILMPMIGTVGKPVIVDVCAKFAIKNVALIKFYENSKVMNIFIKILLESDYFDNAVVSKVKGGTQKFIALGDIRKLEICLPPIELQEQFADFVNQTDKTSFAVKQVLEKAETLKKALMQEYFG